VDNLSNDQFLKISPLLCERISNIATLYPPTGTQKQQTDVVERLATIQGSKLCRIPIFGMKLDKLMSWRLRELYFADDDAGLVVREYPYRFVS